MEMYLPQLLERKYGPNWEAFVDEALEAADAGYDGGSGCEAGGREWTAVTDLRSAL